jgi:hypothetical protein
MKQDMIFRSLRSFVTVRLIGREKNGEYVEMAQWNNQASKKTNQAMMKRCDAWVIAIDEYKR